MTLVGPAQDAAAEGGEGTLVWGMPAETDILDPHATGGWLTYDVTYQIFESFAKEDLTDPNAATPELIPALATSWEISEDGLEYTFYLREGVKFHDGTPFDAAVAKFNFDRFWNESSPHFYAKSKAFVAAYTRWIENVEVIDDITIKVTLNAPNYEWIRSGLQSYGQPLMISPTAVETFGNEGVALNPIGTGPFKFVEREQGVKTVIERNPDYWGRKAKLDRVIFRPLEDPATRINALRTGEIDMTNTPPWDDIQDLVDEGFHLTINENVPFIWFIHLNNRHPILQDVRVRRAMNMAVDRESLVREIFAGTGRAEYGMLSPGTVAYDPNFSSYDYDPEGAKALLAEAGYPEGFELQFDTFQYGLGDVVEQWVARDLGKIGIKVDVKKYEWISYMHEVGRGPQRRRRHERDRLGHDGSVLDRDRCALLLASAGRRQLRLVLQRGGRQAARSGRGRERPGHGAGALPEGQPHHHGRSRLHSAARRHAADLHIGSRQGLSESGGGLGRSVYGRTRRLSAA